MSRSPDETTDVSGNGCLIILIIIVLLGMCGRIEKLENNVKQGTQADTGYYQTESQY